MAAAPSHVGQSSVAGTADSGGGPCNSVGNVPGPVEKCASVTSPIAPDHKISAATRLHSCENPWLPICVATLYLAAAAVHPFADQRFEFRAVDFNRHGRRLLIPLCFYTLSKIHRQGLPRRTPGGAATSDPAEDNRVVSPETVPTCSACPGATRRRRTAHRALGES